ncbi:hypothetical protein P8452_16367 [Trifolium repens]|nr:hypothetical protein P8452_16367 [Trifolium repens]
MTGQLEFQHLNLENSIGAGVRVSLRQANNTGQPNGIVVAAATTLWLPLPAEYVFQFLKDPTKRYQWDVMACGNPIDEVGHISHGLYPGNCTSIFQPHSENYAVILQESFTSPVGSYVIYAPIDTSSMSAVLHGGDSKNIQILPSGFVVCSYAHPNATFEAFNNIGSSSGGVGRIGHIYGASTSAYVLLRSLFRCSLQISIALLNKQTYSFGLFISFTFKDSYYSHPLYMLYIYSFAVNFTTMDYQFKK